MFQFKLDLDPELVRRLQLDNAALIDAYFENDSIVVRVSEEEDMDFDEPNPCLDCPYFHKRRNLSNSSIIY